MWISVALQSMVIKLFTMTFWNDMLTGHIIVKEVVPIAMRPKFQGLVNKNKQQR